LLNPKQLRAEETQGNISFSMLPVLFFFATTNEMEKASSINPELANHPD
jgi:hypothetical protein